MKLSKDLREFIELLNSTGVKYLLVGGHAVAFHGYPRFTGVMDFFVERSENNAVRLEEALRAFGFSGLGIKAADFLQAGIVVQLGHPPNRIDLLTSLDGVSFGQAWANKVTANLDGFPVPVIGKAELIANKHDTGRAQDLADLNKIEDEGA